MNEPDVILKTHHYLKTQMLGQQPVVRLFTDVHGTLLPYALLKPFQRFTLDMGDFVLHPDLVGQLGDGETLFAIEAKGDSDLLRGLAQAEMYQAGFHYTFIAADAAALGSSLVNFARRKNIGVIAVSDTTVTLVHLPEAGMPLREAFRFISRQMESVIQVTGAQTYHFNVPTHYLAWAIVLQPYISYPLSTVAHLLTGYPMPREWKSALQGARKLGLVNIYGTHIELTPVGAAVKEVLPATLAQWANVHAVVGPRGRGIPLVQHMPEAAAVLRLLLLQDPMVRMIVDGLSSFPSRSANFTALAIACDQRDHARAPIFFLKPEAAVALADDKGKINWSQAKKSDYRSRMFYQYKSILKHAGILTDTKLGGASSKTYDPGPDIWALR